MHVAEDRAGKLWVSTWGGLDLLHRNTDDFSHYRHDPENPRSLADNHVMYSYEASDGTFWVLTWSALHKYNSDEDDFTRYIPTDRINEMQYFSRIVEDATGVLWAISNNQGIYRFDPQTAEFKFYKNPHVDDDIRNDWGRKSLEIDAAGDIYFISNRVGLFRFSTTDLLFHKYPLDPERVGNGISSEAVRDLMHLDQNTLFVAVDHGGIHVLDKRTDRFSYIDKDSDGPGGLTTNGISCFHKDAEDILWVGTTRGGIFYNNFSHYQFQTFTISGKSGHSLSGPIVGSIFEDSRGQVWVGTDGDGVNLVDLKSGRVEVINQANSGLRSNIIRSFTESENGDVWILTWRGGLHRYRSDTKEVEFVGFPDSLDELIQNQGSWGFQIDSKNRYWLSTNPNLILLDEDFNLVKPFTGKSTTGSRVGRIYEYDDGTIFSTNNDGAYIFDEVNLEMVPFVEDLQIIHMARDRSGRCYFATSDLGLFIYDKDGNQLLRISKADGLTDNTLRSLQLVDDSVLWVATDSGMSRVDLLDYSITNFFEQDGLQGNSYFMQSSLALRDGTLAFGGTKGVSFWDPRSITRRSFDAPVHINGMRISNLPLDMNALRDEGGDESNSAISLDWNSKTITFEFSAVSFTYPEKIQYAYRLEGLDNDWIHADSRERKATFTKLSPGEYRLVVKAADQYGNWSPYRATLTIRIIPPFWMTWWFFALFAICVYVAIYFYLRFREGKLRREKRKLKVQVKERTELIGQMALAKEHAEKSDKLKSMFLANMSHEIRTPMNSIIGYSQLLTESEFSESEKVSFAGNISTSAESLLRLIEDILDFSMIEADQLKIEKRQFSLTNLLDEIYAAFQVFQRPEGVEFIYQNSFAERVVELRSDHHRIRQIISNFLSNAFKFTHEGCVKFGLRENLDTYVIYVKDTGDGMSEGEQQAIFKEFVRLDRHNKAAIAGVGLGLSISMRLAKLLELDIEVESEKGVGTEFRLILPKPAED